MSLAGPHSEPATTSPVAGSKPKPRRTCGTPGCERPDFHPGPCSSVDLGGRRMAPKAHAADVFRPPNIGGLIASGKLAARKVPGKAAVPPRKQPPSQRTPEEQAARKRARTVAPSDMMSHPLRQQPRLWSGGSGSGDDGKHTGREAVRLGDRYQAELPPLLVDSVEPPPAAPPRCWCAAPAAWSHRRWWCAADACEFEAAPPPRAAPSTTPLCRCGTAAVWLRGRWWCGVGGGERSGDGGEAGSSEGSSKRRGEGGKAEADAGGVASGGVASSAAGGAAGTVPRGCGFEQSAASLADPPEPVLLQPETIVVACARSAAGLKGFQVGSGRGSGWLILPQVASGCLIMPQGA